jgi:hypothetical protein
LVQLSGGTGMLNKKARCQLPKANMIQLPDQRCSRRPCQPKNEDLRHCLLLSRLYKMYRIMSIGSLFIVKVHHKPCTTQNVLGAHSGSRLGAERGVAFRASASPRSRLKFRRNAERLTPPSSTSQEPKPPGCTPHTKEQS